MMMINLAGTSFVDYDLLKKYRKKLDDKKSIYCNIEKRMVSPTPPVDIYDSDYAVITYQGDLIGWIPKMKTIKKYMGEAFKDQDRFRHDTQYQRAKWTEKIRNNVTVDIHRNDITPNCRLDGIYHLQKARGWGVVVEFSYVD